MNKFDYDLLQIDKAQFENAMKFLFTGYDDAMERGGVKLQNYKKVWSGTIHSNTPVSACCDLYFIFNQSDRPNGRLGHSMSVSDIIKLTGEDGIAQYWFVDEIGFKRLDKEV